MKNYLYGIVSILFLMFVGMLCIQGYNLYHLGNELQNSGFSNLAANHLGQIIHNFIYMFIIALGLKLCIIGISK
jgi:hypothetical protein